jgi:hypothetical protein
LDSVCVQFLAIPVPSAYETVAERRGSMLPRLSVSKGLAMGWPVWLIDCHHAEGDSRGDVGQLTGPLRARHSPCRPISGICSTRSLRGGLARQRGIVSAPWGDVRHGGRSPGRRPATSLPVNEAKQYDDGDLTGNAHGHDFQPCNQRVSNEFAHSMSPERFGFRNCGINYGTTVTKFGFRAEGQETLLSRQEWLRRGSTLAGLLWLETRTADEEWMQGVQGGVSDTCQVLVTTQRPMKSLLINEPFDLIASSCPISPPLHCGGNRINLVVLLAFLHDQEFCERLVRGRVDRQCRIQ